MLHWSLVCCIVLLAAFAQFGGVAVAFSGTEKAVFFFLLASLAITLILDFLTARRRLY